MSIEKMLIPLHKNMIWLFLNTKKGSAGFIFPIDKLGQESWEEDHKIMRVIADFLEECN